MRAPSASQQPAIVAAARRLARLYPLLVVAIAWEAVARLGLVRPAFLPSLSDVLVRLSQLAASGDLVAPLLVSLYRASAGLAISMVVGIALGLLMSQSRWVDALLTPLVAIGFPTPKVVFIPIFILWFGIDHLSKIALVVAFCVFPFLIAAKAGADSVPRVQLWAARAMGSTRFDLLWRIVLPASLPSLMSGIRVAVPYALVSAFTAEMIAGGGGLGGDLVYAGRYFETPTVFAILIVMLTTGYVIDHGVSFLRRHFLRWQA